MNEELDLSDEMSDLWRQLRESCEDILDYDDEIDVAVEDYRLPAEIDQLHKTLEAFNRQWAKEI